MTIKFIPSDDNTYLTEDEQYGILVRKDGKVLVYELNEDTEQYEYMGKKVGSIQEAEYWLTARERQGEEEKRFCDDCDPINNPKCNICIGS